MACDCQRCAAQTAAPKSNGRIRMFLAGLVILGVATAFILRDELPTVYESWEREECVKVTNTKGVYSCDNLPPKYNHIWTK